METNVGLDQKDLMILYLLQQDSRMTLSDLGKTLEMTPAAVSYRLKRLKDQKIIKKFSILLNHEILTPNYHSFVLEVTINDRKDLGVILSMLFQSTYIERILEVASSTPLFAITLPLSGKDLKHLTNLLTSDTISNFRIIPILKDHSDFSEELVGENISKIYCPLCQKTITGEGIITKVGTKHLSFCCRECKDQFNEKYAKIAES